MKVTYELTREDYRHAYRFSLGRTLDPSRHQERVVRWFLMGGCFLVVASLTQGAIVEFALLVPFVLTVGAFELAYERLVPRLRAGAWADHYFDLYDMGGEYTVEMEPEGVSSWSSKGNDFIYWEGIQRVAQDDHYIYISLRAPFLHIVPKRNFSDAETEKFYETARSYLEKSKSRWNNVADA